jgi:hypothetical protein
MADCDLFSLGSGVDLTVILAAETIATTVFSARLLAILTGSG